VAASSTDIHAFKVFVERLASVAVVLPSSELCGGGKEARSCENADQPLPENVAFPERENLL
jgi:hypothetical protein